MIEELSLRELFEVAHGDLRCNTSYPAFKRIYARYLGSGDLFAEVSSLSYYIHVPFCRSLCSFCEYTRFIAGDSRAERKYLSVLADQVKSFLADHDIMKICGLDIGGGTPTALQDGEFSKLLDIADMLAGSAAPSEDFEKSIEISFPTASKRKLELIRDHGFRRVSAGLQSADARFMRNCGRDHTGIETMLSVRDLALAIGIEKLNIDLMYGMEGQTLQSIDDDLEAIRAVRPEQVTLYEMRYNSFGRIPQGLTRDVLYDQYERLFDGLVGMGYRADFGQNAFSIDEGDCGVSSYLKHRMLDCVPYKGFGISAQSMSDKGISYGTLKGSSNRTLPAIDVLGEDFVYVLPGEELAGKYVCIALYGGRFKLSVLSRLTGEDACSRFKGELDFLEERGYVSIEGDIVSVTRKGFRYYGAVAALFWSRDQQKELLMQHGRI